MNAFGKSIRALIWLAGVAALGAAGWVGVNKYRGTQTTSELPVAQAREGEFLAIIRCRGGLCCGRCGIRRYGRCGSGRGGGYRRGVCGLRIFAGGGGVAATGGGDFLRRHGRNGFRHGRAGFYGLGALRVIRRVVFACSIFRHGDHAPDFIAHIICHQQRAF